MSKLAPYAVRLAALWILAGGLAKLFLGTPANLPGPIRDVLFGPDLNFRFAIVVEIAVGTLALLLPRYAWPFIAGALVVFIGILLKLVMAGEDACGCFGEKFPIPPAGMLAIDGVLLVVLLASQPWKLPAAKGEGRRWLAWVPLAALGAIGPWMVIQAPPTAPPPAADGGPVAWSLPPRESWPRYLTPDTASWVGQSVSAIPELATWFDVSMWPPDATVILWQRSCDHCGEHLRELALADDGSRLFVLIRLPGDEDQESLVDLRPTVIPEYDLDFPEGIEFVVETPVELEVAGGIVTAAHEGAAE